MSKSLNSPTHIIRGVWTYTKTTINFIFSKLVCAEVSKITGVSESVFHQTVNAQNSMLTKEIHDQGEKTLIL